MSYFQIKVTFNGFWIDVIFEVKVIQRSRSMKYPVASNTNGSSVEVPTKIQPKSAGFWQGFFFEIPPCQSQVDFGKEIQRRYASFLTAKYTYCLLDRFFTSPYHWFGPSPYENQSNLAENFSDIPYHFVQGGLIFVSSR